MSATCRGCGKPIIWGMTDDGKKIPLDPRAPVYVVRLMNDGTYGCQRAPKFEEGQLTPVGLVSHFATCPKANEFSSGRKRVGAPGGPKLAA